MTSTPTSMPQNIVSASAYLHLAPSASDSSSSGDYDRSEIRQLVLEYLCSGCYADSARAFAKEVSRRDAEDQAPGKAGGTGRRRKRSEGLMVMEGVEATPNPEASRDGMLLEEEGEGAESDREVERRLTVGKSVAFKVDADGVDVPLKQVDEDDDEGRSMLSKEQLREVRLRRGESRFVVVESLITTLDRRTDIREAILAGRIQVAVDLLNEHFPSVLAEPSPSASPAPPKGIPKPCLPTNFFVSTPRSPAPPPSSTTSNGSSLPVLGATFGSWSLSLSPSILALNLQMQTFVELMRVAHSSPSRTSTPAPTPLSDSFLSTASNGTDPMSTSTSSLSSPTSTLALAISRSQSLSMRVRALPPGKDREAWERECIDVAGLLAYKDLSSCPVRGYLAQARRETLAELVNSAILRACCPLIVLLSSLTDRCRNLDRKPWADSTFTPGARHSADHRNLANPRRMEGAVPAVHLGRQEREGRQGEGEGAD